MKHLIFHFSSYIIHIFVWKSFMLKFISPSNGFYQKTTAVNKKFKFYIFLQISILNCFSKDGICVTRWQFNKERFGIITQLLFMMPSRDVFLEYLWLNIFCIYCILVLSDSFLAVCWQATRKIDQNDIIAIHDVSIICNSKVTLQSSIKPHCKKHSVVCWLEN